MIDIPVRVLREDHGVISGEHSGVVVQGDQENALASPWDGNSLVTVREDAPSDLWVNAGDQWGPYDVTTRLLDSRPGAAAEGWEDVVEISIASPGTLVVTELMSNEPRVALIDAPGDYRLRVSARGRVVDREDDAEPALSLSEKPIEWFLLEAWPEPPTEPTVVRLTSPYAQFVIDPPAPLAIPEGEAGLAAAGRIGRDVDAKPGSRSLSGETGAVSVSRTIRGTRRKLFRPLAFLTSWSHWWLDGPSWSWSGTGGLDYELGEPSWAYSHDHLDQLTGSTGGVEVAFLEVENPGRAVREWKWLANPERPRSPRTKLVPLLPQATVMTVSLTQSRDEAGDPWTTIRIDHQRLPIEWVEDMETYWAYQLSIADHAEFGVTK